MDTNSGYSGLHSYEAEPNHRLLHRLSIWGYNPECENDGCWLVFIHGGAWRDPRQDLQCFVPAKDYITSHPELISPSVIAGFASINYRLSPHPKFPDPPGTPNSERHEARHPDHIKDLWLALDFLQNHMGVCRRYVLIGHSAGATLALQLLMGASVLGRNPFQYGLPCSTLDPQADEFPRHTRHHKDMRAAKVPLDIEPPVAVLGLAGIYDFNGLNERSNGTMAEIFRGAFGEGPSQWNAASPALFNDGFGKAFPGTKLVLLAWAPGDQYIDEPEINSMAAILERDGVDCRVIKDLPGDHDNSWEDGSIIARLVQKILEVLEWPTP